MYTCRLPSEHSLDNTAGCFSQLDRIQPVIVFLSTKKVATWNEVGPREPFFASIGKV
jgi:hypothetical protein